MKQVKKFITNKYVLFALGIVFVFILWLIISALFDIGNMMVPSPIDTFKVAGEYLANGSTYKYLGLSLIKMLIGFAFAFIVAFLLALFVNNSEKRYNFLTPLMSTFKVIPTAAVVFLFMVICGSKNAPIFVVFLISMPILYESIVGGIRSVNNNIIQASKIDGANNFNTLIKVKLPNAVPYILVGLFSSFSLSFKIEIMAEIITGDTTSGLGAAIKGAQLAYMPDMTPVFAYSLIAVVLMILVTIGANIFKQKMIQNR